MQHRPQKQLSLGESFVFQVWSVVPTPSEENSLLMFGTTLEGTSVCVKINDFYPYFYYTVPGKRPPRTEDIKAQIQPEPSFVVHAPNKSSLYLHCAQEFQAFRIYAKDMKHFYSMRKSIDQSKMYEERGLSLADRFLIDQAIVPLGWVKLSPNSWSYNTAPVSKCGIDIVCTRGIETIIPLSGDTGNGLVPANETLANKVAPLYTLWLDIECVDPRKCFPDPEYAEVIMVAMVGAIGEKVCFKKVLHLKTITAAEDCPLEKCVSEKELLLKVAACIAAFDADMIGSYNGNDFDLPFLVNRSRVLKCDTDFLKTLSRVWNVEAKLKKTHFESNAHGKRDSFTLETYGRVSWDLLHIIRREYKDMSSYTLNAVSERWLGDRKADVHHSMIAKLWEREDDDRLRLARYCLKDTLLPLQVDHKLIMQLRYVEMARVCGVDFTTLLERGQQIKVVSQLARMGRVENFLLPLKHEFKGIGGHSVGVTGYAPVGKFEGATVLEPMVGYYSREKPVIILDFKSLYPSLQIEHNMSYDTFVPKSKAIKEEMKDKVKKTAAGHYFLSTDELGVIPRIQQLLLGQRQKVKKMMKQVAKEGNTFMANVLDARQLALKISANSVYGFTGVSFNAGGMLPLFECGESTTAEGRQALLKAKTYAEKEGFVCIYGDTGKIKRKEKNDYFSR